MNELFSILTIAFILTRLDARKLLSDNASICYYDARDQAISMEPRMLREYWTAIRESGSEKKSTLRHHRLIDLTKLEITKIETRTRERNISYPKRVIDVDWIVYSGDIKLIKEKYEHLCTIDADHYDRWKKLVHRILAKGGKIYKNSTTGMPFCDTFTHVKRFNNICVVEDDSNDWCWKRLTETDGCIIAHNGRC